MTYIHRDAVEDRGSLTPHARLCPRHALPSTPLTDPQDDRSPLAQAMALVATITTVAMEMVVPVVAGHWLDKRVGCTPALTIAGAAGGLVLGLWHLIQMSRRPKGMD